MSIVNNLRPLHFIRLRDNLFEIPQETRQFLRNLKNPLGVITIVGKYRTGKSLFLNKVLLRNTTFKVSPTINSCTKGLWLCHETIKSEGSQDIDILVIDTEGFGATQQTDAYTNKIILFSMLLSSYFIYNSVGNIDQNSLNNLNIIANIAKDIQNSNSKGIEEQFPSFLWLIRDFSLNLVDKNGFPIEPKQYLEQALQNQKGNSDAIENKNKIRRMIKHFFKERDCFTLVRPVETQEKLQNLVTLSDKDYRSQFLQQITILRSKILRKVRSKKIKGKSLDGQTLLQMANFYVDIINQGSLPNFQSTYRQIMKFQLNRATNQFAITCKAKLSKFGEQMRSEVQITAIQLQIKKDLQQHFKQGSGQAQQLKSTTQRLSKEIQQLITTFRQTNYNKMISNCNEIWQKCYQQNKDLSEQYQIEQYFRHVEQQFLSKLKKAKNTLSEEYFKNIVLTYKNLQYNKFIKKMLALQLSQTNKKEKYINQLNTKNAQLQLKNNNLNEEFYALKNEHTKLQSYHNKYQHEKQTQIGILRQRQADKIKYIKQLQQSSKDLSKQLQTLKENSSQLSSGNAELQRNIRQIHEQKRLLEKELIIQKQNLISKNEQIHQLQLDNNKLSIFLDNYKEKYDVFTMKAENQTDNKNNQIIQLRKANDRLNYEIIEVNSKLAKVEQQWRSHSNNFNSEKKLYESMFDNFKDSLKKESNSRLQLVETNKHLSEALNHLEKRVQQAQEKQKQLKQYKKCVKNASCLQCQHCTKFFVPSIFIPHLNVCLIGPQALKMTRLQNSKIQNIAKMEVKIRQTLVKEDQGKPYTEYIIQFKKNGVQWNIYRKYKSFCDLNSALKAVLPGVQLSNVSYIVNPQQISKKSIVIEQRRKVLQKYLIDLSNNQLVVSTLAWRQFIEEPSEISVNSPLKENKKILNNEQTPEEFFKIWNQRKIRGKQSSMAKIQRQIL